MIGRSRYRRPMNSPYACALARVKIFASPVFQYLL